MIEIKIDLLDIFKKLRSRKNIMVDGETEEIKVKSSPMFINADEISDTPGQNMGDIAREHKPELTHRK